MHIKTKRDETEKEKLNKFIKKRQRQEERENHEGDRRQRRKALL